MQFQKLQNARRTRRAARVRKKITGTADKPRLSVFRSLRSTSAQLIDDQAGKTLAAVTTREIKGKLKKTDAAIQAGTLLAERAAKAGIKTVVFDRSFYKFHGRIKALAEAARKAGLVF